MIVPIINSSKIRAFAVIVFNIVIVIFFYCHNYYIYYWRHHFLFLFALFSLPYSSIHSGFVHSFRKIFDSPSALRKYLNKLLSLLSQASAVPGTLRLRQRLLHQRPVHSGPRPLTDRHHRQLTTGLWLPGKGDNCMAGNIAMWEMDESTNFATVFTSAYYLTFYE